ncbi:MAG: glycosyltransferase family 4 protein [Myxococcales bacterium]|nr:glycosyltransferase family 4 protein [Myxococcales bacterium]
MSSPLRFTFVVSRYAADILGGAEKHARDVAEQLAARGHDVRVLSTCARQYSTWKNELPPGVAHEGGVEVVRFPIPLRRLVGVDDVCKAMACRFPTRRVLADAWYVAAGPVCPALVRRAITETHTRDLVTHFSLLSWVTAHALEAEPRRAALVPLVHDEPPTYLSRAAETLRLPAAILANTEEEWARIARVAGPSVAPGLVVATGQGPAPALDPSFRPPVDGPYLLLLGRMAKARPVIAAYRALRALDATLEVGGKQIAARDLTLLAVGERHRAFDGEAGVHMTGFVDDETRWQLLHRATALVNPSRYESLSLVLLEAWACGVPVVVNAACDVTVGQCARSDGGFAVDFEDPAAAAKALLAGLASEERRRAMGAHGKAYVERRYAWDRVTRLYEAVARGMRDGDLDVTKLG